MNRITKSLGVGVLGVGMALGLSSSVLAHWPRRGTGIYYGGYRPVVVAPVYSSPVYYGSYYRPTVPYYGGYYSAYRPAPRVSIGIGIGPAFGPSQGYGRGFGYYGRPFYPW
jgi:hypothetical protein